MNVYDMLRAKAEAMGHKAANLPDEIWQKFYDKRDERAVLNEAKLYVENYMMGNIDAVEFAQVMAEDDRLRYTISDLCRTRLEATEFDMPERNNGYIDVGAGIKTFWAEIKVPLPSEIEAAKDLRNIYFGIEAGRATANNGFAQNMSDENSERQRSFRDIIHDARDKMEEMPEKKRTIRDRLHDARVSLAEKALEKLQSYVETEKSSKQQDNESWLDTDEGRTYKNECTRRAAQHIENMTMNIENDKNLDSDHTNAEQTGIRSGYSADDLNGSVNDDMKALFDQIMEHVNHNKNDIKTEQSETQPADNERKGYVEGVFDGKPVTFKDSWSNHTFTQDETDRLLAGEIISIDYTSKNGMPRTVSGRLEWQNNNGHEYFGFKADFSKNNDYDQDKMSDNQDISYSDIPDIPDIPVSESTEVDLSLPDESLFRDQDDALMRYYMDNYDYEDSDVEVDADSEVDAEVEFELNVSDITVFEQARQYT